MMHKACRRIEEVSYCFSSSSIKFHGHTGGKLTIWIQFEITRPVAAIKSLRFALVFLYIRRFVIVLVSLKTLPIPLIYGYHVLFALFPTDVILGSIFRDILWIKKW